MSPGETIVITIASVIIGGLITWFASKHYYMKSANELELVTDAMAALLEKHLGKDETKFHRNKKGRIIGLEHNCKD